MGFRGRVLCIDDDEKVNRALAWALQKEFAVQTTGRVVEAVELIRRGDFDAVISDRGMPEMNGIDFLNIVRKVSPRSTRILISGFPDAGSVVRAVNEAEVFRILGKPWNGGELLSCVRHAVAISRDVATELSAALHEVEAPLGPAAAVPCRLLVIDDDARMPDLVAAAAGDSAEVCRAGTIAEAMTIISEQPLAVIVAATTVGGIDTTRLIRLLKHSRPEIVAMIAGEHPDPVQMAELVNQGQVFRFVGKPIAPNFLAAALAAARRKHGTLAAVPKARHRHQVERAPAGLAVSLLHDIERVAFSGGRDGRQLDRVGRLRAGFYRVFGGHRREPPMACKPPAPEKNPGPDAPGV